MAQRSPKLGWSRLGWRLPWMLLAVPSLAWAQAPNSYPGHVDANRIVRQWPISPSVLTRSSSSSSAAEDLSAQEDLEHCRVHRVTGFPGSHQFASDFVEAMAVDPGLGATNVVWGLTADLSSKVPAQDRAMYISKSTDGGKTWVQIARLGPEYFDAGIGEGERNGLAVAPGGGEFVITTQRGAFQVIPQSGASGAHEGSGSRFNRSINRSINRSVNRSVIRSIDGPRVTELNPFIMIPKRVGDPVTANVVKITADGKHLLLGYGYFDLNPRILTYRKTSAGSWARDGALPPLPTKLDLLSMEFEDRKVSPSLYVGTGDQAFRLKGRTGKWTRIRGVGPDSAIQEISTVGGPHLAACWGVYNPIDADTVERVTKATFLLHRDSDEAGSNIRAFGIQVDPARPNREVVTSLTGAYTSRDYGKSWRRLNDLPDGEYRSAHFNPEDGSIIISGIEGTFLANPFLPGCSAHLKIRDR